MIRWLTILGMAAVTYLTRVTPMVLLKNRPPSPRVRSYLTHVPVAVLTAMVAPALLVYNGHLFLSVANRDLIAGLICVGWAFKSRSMLQTILIGVIALIGLMLIGL